MTLIVSALTLAPAIWIKWLGEQKKDEEGKGKKEIDRKGVRVMIVQRDREDESLQHSDGQTLALRPPVHHEESTQQRPKRQQGKEDAQSG
jgi:phage gp37-like protein